MNQSPNQLSLNVARFCVSNHSVEELHWQLCQYEDHALRMIHEYFQDDLLHILETMHITSLLSELHARNLPDVEKYQSLENDRKTFARTLLQDIYQRGREAVIGLWVSLDVLRSRHGSPGLQALLDELRHRGDTLVEQIILDKYGHSLTSEIADVKNNHKEHLYSKTKKFVEYQPLGCNQGEESFPFNTRYVNLIIVSTDHFREHTENELVVTGERQVEYFKKKQNELQCIFPNKLFRWCHRSGLVPQMVMVSGVPGVGKTTLMQRIVYDWVRGDLYQRFSFVFFFKFRELNRLDNVSLENMILHQYPHLAPQLGTILQDPEKLLFIFDGLDESLHTMDFTSHHLCTNPKLHKPCGEIVVSLVKKSLLKGCSVLMTSRPTRLASLNCKIFERKVEIIGFSPEERQMYFENFFSNSELAEKAFTYVKQNETLYTFCYIPSYCWIICTVLSRSFQPSSSDQPVSLLPKTVTQLFAIFIANILANHSLHKSDAQKILQSVGWMAEHGVMNHRVIFDDRDLDSFRVDNKSKLLSSFLMESVEPVTYSFLHLTVQEFFSALVHYVDYSTERLQKSLKEAKSFSDGRGEIFLRFLCGLSDNSTRSILTSYLDAQAAQASTDVITWMKDLFSEEQRLLEIQDRRRLLNTFFYLFETRNKILMQELLKSHRRLELCCVHMSSLDCMVLAFILETCKNLEELNLYGCTLDNEGLDRLSPALHNLHNLSLAENNLPESFCNKLTSVIGSNQSLKKLVLSHNRLSGHQFSDFMAALSSPFCMIEELHFVGNNGVPVTSFIQLACGIRNNQTLKILDLRNNHLSGPHFGDLMEALSSADNRIEELCLADNDLPHTSCIQLASLIKNNRSLQILDLSNNRLSGLHFSDLMEALSSSECGIEELPLWDNGLSGEEKEKIRKLKKDKANLNIYY
ncbi:NACHT, LRR and PYD domains-containing protein 3-like [Dendrobates tinctorius]|uniref:NACHT, LRR and PYD domains-containing protein 3-like n=1 Tax=Dendrobates tinctorius TaxID=92724 RepID=UPI003CC94440